MQVVSQAWKTNQSQRLVSESQIELSYTISDPYAQEDATATDNGHVYFSNVSETVDSITTYPAKYSTLEHNQWLLDGSFENLPNSSFQGSNGYIGDSISDISEDFSTPPKIIIDFSKTHEDLIPGITINWATAYEEWAKKFSVKAFKASVLAAETTVENNKDLMSVVELDIENYDQIQIEILEWCMPYRRTRVSEITLGVVKVYRNSDLVNYTHTITVDPLSASLPKTEINFEILNLNGEYNPDNPSGLSKYLIERQKLVARYGYKIDQSIEWIQGGEFYLAEWETPQNGITASFRARDLLEFMSESYTGTLEGSLYDIALDALMQANLPLNSDGSVKWKISGVLRNINVPLLNENDKDTLRENTISEILQLVANAGCCVIYQDRQGYLRIEPRTFSSAEDYIIDQNNSYANSEITLSKPIKEININNGSYVFSINSTGEVETVNNPLVSEAQAPQVAEWVANFLKIRKNFTGEYRADPRLDALDSIKVINQFSESNVLITEVNYTYNGAFRGSYKGRSESGQVAVHNFFPYAHQNIILDGNVIASTVKNESDLEKHMIDPYAHPNIIVDGNQIV